MTEAYDLLIIGGGSAGLSAAMFGIRAGKRVALIEKHRVGGDCTWSGCVPSKTFLKAAKVAHHMRTAASYGVTPVEPRVDLREVMAHVQHVIAETYQEETPEALRAAGIDVFLGEARFLDPNTLSVGDTELKAHYVLVATGAHPFTPPVEGLADTDYLTYETVWQLDVLPEHLLVIGGGPIGSELAQGFRRLGSQVTMLVSRDRLLPRDDPAASRVIGQVFEAEGIDVRYNARATRAWQDNGAIHVLAGEQEVVGDALLLVAGRRPNVEGMDLERAGVAYSGKGIQVDDTLRTTQSHIFAAGDCIGSFQFTHYAGFQARTAARNALFGDSRKGVREWVVWTTFTDPEVAAAGFTEPGARERFGDNTVAAVEHPMERVDRARTDGDTSGLVKVIYSKNDGTPLGATIVSERAGELIHEWIYALEYGLTLEDITRSIHSYPSFSRANVKAARAVLQATVGPAYDVPNRIGRHSNPRRGSLRGTVDHSTASGREAQPCQPSGTHGASVARRRT
jgi:pyruvate/2-oxoglutarate dehydrogenase complex dihydrolipoamide dehydrogenase (E3) component